MKIYTRTGDKGETSLFGGGRVMKNHPRVQAYGTLDEVNSLLGAVLAFLPSDLKEVQKNLFWLQNRLFDLGAELATATDTALAKLSRLIGDEEIQYLENTIDDWEKVLPSLKNFILPGGHPSAALLHVARATLRRCERVVLNVPNLRPQVLAFLNRSSDFLFVAARYINFTLAIAEKEWS